MDESVTEVANPGNDLEKAAARLDQGLAEVSSAVAEIRDLVPRVVLLSRLMAELEAALARIRLGHDIPAATPEGKIGLATSRQSELADSDTGVGKVEPIRLAAWERAPVGTSEGAHAACRHLRLELCVHEGTLDLEAIDVSLREQDGVMDVALLDYEDGRAAFRIAVDRTADAELLRRSLVQSLQRELRSAQVTASLEEPAIDERAAA